MRRWSGMLVVALCPVLFLGACLPYPADMTQRDPTAADPALLRAEHFDGTRFDNPWNPFTLGPTDLVRFLLTRNPWDKSKRLEVPVVANDGADLTGEQESPTITWVGHATFAIHDGPDVVLTDPHFGPRAFIPARQFPPGIPLAAVPSNAFAVLSHNHYDHLDTYTVERLPASMHWFVPRGLADWFRAHDRPNVVELDWWESVRHGRWTLTCLPAQHWSRRFGQGTNTTLWCSWLLDSGTQRYYFAGDTGYFRGFAEFQRRFDPIDVALLPIGAYEPRWFMGYQHMNPTEAYRAFQDLGARYMLPMHWGTFDLTFEPIDEAAREFRRVVAAAGGDPERTPVLAIGEQWRVPVRPEVRVAAPGRGP